MALRDDDTGREASLEAVLAELKRGKAVPCYLLYGEEEFRLRDGLERITAALIPHAPDRELNLFATDGEHEDIGALCESLITPPLLPGRKVVVIRETRLFESKKQLASLIARIRERLEPDPARAAADFMQFLKLTGMQLDDLRDGGWRKIDDDAWRRIVPDDGGGDRETWLPRAVELCTSRGAVEGREETEDEASLLERVLNGGMPEGNHLILTAGTVDRRKRLFKAILSLGIVLVFDRISGEGRLKDKARQDAVQKMAAGLLKSRGKRLSADAWTVLGQKTGFSLRESLGEIEKLTDYAGEREVIEAADVEAVTGRTKEETVFDLARALAARNLTAATRSLGELLDQDEPPLKIFSIIVREIRILLQAKLLIASGRLRSFDSDMDFGQFQRIVYPAMNKLSGDGGVEGISMLPKTPYPVYLALKNAGRFSRSELAGFLEMLVRIDLALKTTGRNERILLERFLLAVCKTPTGSRR